ncbi:MAG: sulfotransferase, partial [Mycobacterium sp.]
MGQFDAVTTPDDVLKLAAERTGVSDIDSDSWRPGLAIMLDEINTSPAFTPQGREQLIDDSINALGRRLQIHDYLQLHPDVLDAPVERPLVVLGMPRTGTTVISYLLDQDPARRSLLHWECLHPVPPA